MFEHVDVDRKKMTGLKTPLLQIPAGAVITILLLAMLAGSGQMFLIGLAVTATGGFLAFDYRRTESHRSTRRANAILFAIAICDGIATGFSTSLSCGLAAAALVLTGYIFIRPIVIDIQGVPSKSP